MYSRQLLAICIVLIIGWQPCWAGDPKKDLRKKWSGMGDSPLLNPQTENPIRLGALIEIKETESDLLPFLPPASDYSWIDKTAAFPEHTEPPDVIDRIAKLEFNAQYTPFAREINRDTVKALYQAQTRIHLKPGTTRVKMLGTDNLIAECQKVQERQLTKDYCERVLRGKLYIVYAIRIVDSIDYTVESKKAGAVSFRGGVDAPDCPKPSSQPPQTPAADGEKPPSSQQTASTPDSGSSAGLGVCVRNEYTLAVTTPHIFSVRVGHFDKKMNKVDGSKRYTITVP